MTPAEVQFALGRFASTRDSAAFAQLVHAHIDLVYASARRQVTDTATADDVTQNVFILLAKKGPRLGRGTLLSGWLLRATRYCAADANRERVRRQRHEREAAAMKSDVAAVDGDVIDILSKVDEAMAGLGATDRAAVAMRYLQQRPMGEIAQVLGVAEEAAKKRVLRAMERLRGRLMPLRRTITVAALGGALEQSVSVTAPPALAGMVTTAAISSTAASASGIVGAVIHLLAYWKIGVAAVALLVGSVVAVDVLQSPGGNPSHAVAAAGAMMAATAPTSAPSITEKVSGNTCNGNVVLPDGSPAKGADVYLFNSPGEQAVTKTDDGGAFHFDNVGENSNRQVVVAVAKGWGMTGEENGNSGAVRLRLRPAVDVTAKFVDTQGKPVVDMGVSVRVITFQDGIGDISAFVIPATDRAPFAQRTDDSGAITFVGLPQSCQMQLAVNDDRFAGLTYANAITIPNKESFTAKPIVLHAAGSISGKVIFAATGKPAAGVEIGAQSTLGGGSAVTAADGSYHMSRLGADKYNVALGLTGDMEKSWTAVATEGLSIGEGENKQGVDFSLIGGGLISGKVLAKGSGEPIAGVDVGVYGPAHPKSGAWVQSAKTGTDGSFSLRVPPGEQYVYVMISQELVGDTSQTITVADGKMTAVEFRIPSISNLSDSTPALSAVIRGKVVGPDGAGVADAIIAMAYRGNGGMQPIGARSGTDGSFRLESGIDAKGPELRVRSGDLATRTAVNVLPGSKDVIIRLEKGVLASIKGRVVDGDGKALDGVQIELMVMGDRSGYGEITGLTDEKGEFRIGNLFADLRYSVDVQADGYGKASTKQIKVKAGGVVKVKDLVLRKRDAFVAGTVLGDDGNPVAGLQLTLQCPLSGVSIVNTDKDGKFRVAVVAGDTPTIFYQIKGHSLTGKKVKAGDEDIMIDPMAETIK